MNAVSLEEAELFVIMWGLGALVLFYLGIPYVKDVRKVNVHVARLYERAYRKARPKILGAWLAFGLFEILAFTLARLDGTEALWVRTTGIPCLHGLAELMAISSLTLAITFIFGGSNLMGHLLMPYQLEGSQRALSAARNILRRSTGIAGVILLLPILVIGYLGTPTNVTLAIAAALILGPQLDPSVAELGRVEAIASKRSIKGKDDLRD